MSREKRLRDLENRVLKQPEFGTSQICLTDEAECTLFDACKRIIGNMDLNGGKITANEQHLLDQLGEIMWVRAYDIFAECVGSLVCAFNPDDLLLFKYHLVQFVKKEAALFKADREAAKSC